MPGNYAGLGINLLYPENWKVDEDVEDSVSFETPSGAFLTISQHASDLPSAEVLAQATSTMEEEYEMIEQEESQLEVGSRKLPTLTQRFVFLDLIVVTQLMTLAAENHTYLLQIQGEDRELEQLQPVFLAIITSMCQSLE